jgi:hypothetical protein
MVLIALRTPHTNVDELRCRLKNEKTTSCDSITADVAELGVTTDPVARPQEEGPTTADAGELGGATDAMQDLQLHPDEASGHRDQVEHALAKVKQAFLKVEEDDVKQGPDDEVDWGSSSDEEGAAPDGCGQNRGRTRTPRQRSLSPKSEPSPHRRLVPVSDHGL